MKPTSLQRTGDFLQQIRCYLYASILPLCEWADGGVLWLAHVAACHHWCPSCPSSCLCMAWTWGLALSDLPHVPHHCLSQHCFTTELWKPTCFEEQFFFAIFFYEEQKVTREWLRLMKDIWFCCMKTQLSHVLPLQLREISPPFASILATPCSQHHVIHHQALCIHPIATCIANSPRVSAEELSWRLLPRFLLEAELCCFANQHSSWVNTA